MNRRRFAISRNLIEIDITYQCNLACINCCRFCGKFPTKEKMTVDQICKFISESKKKKISWKYISLLGGEPTLHPDLIEIIRVLKEYSDELVDCRLAISTNGYMRQSLKILSKIPRGVEIINSRKKSSFQIFDTIMVAPIDCIEFDDADYTKGCRIIKNCGIGLTPYGYYPCAVAGAIDRICGYDLGRKSIPDINDNMCDLLNVFCRLCGHFKHLDFMGNIEVIKEKYWTTEEEISKTWNAINSKYIKDRKELTIY